MSYLSRKVKESELGEIFVPAICETIGTIGDIMTRAAMQRGLVLTNAERDSIEGEALFLLMWMTGEEFSEDRQLGAVLENTFLRFGNAFPDTRADTSTHADRFRSEMRRHSRLYDVAIKSHPTGTERLAKTVLTQMLPDLTQASTAYLPLVETMSRCIAGYSRGLKSFRSQAPSIFGVFRTTLDDRKPNWPQPSRQTDALRLTKIGINEWGSAFRELTST